VFGSEEGLDIRGGLINDGDEEKVPDYIKRGVKCRTPKTMCWNGGQQVLNGEVGYNYLVLCHDARDAVFRDCFHDEDERKERKKKRDWYVSVTIGTRCLKRVQKIGARGVCSTLWGSF